AIALAVVWSLPLSNFWLFLLLFLALFTASGFGNGATYRMIPRIFAIRGGEAGAGRGGVASQRKSAAALGLNSAIGASGGFVIPQVLNASSTATGSYDGAFYGFVGAYALMLVLAWFCYLRPGSKMAQGGV
ncbi:MFS transporter, partial [Arthrobacter deserti]|nr:MFS transporter [Arthrobacter deserti]